MARDLSFRAPPSLAVSINATTPVGELGAEIWSTIANKKLVWDGGKWADAMGSGSATGQITVSSTAPANPTLNQLWLQI